MDRRLLLELACLLDAQPFISPSGGFMSNTIIRGLFLVSAVMAMPVLMGAKGNGCGGGGNPAFDQSAAPNMAGDWSVAYDDALDVEITIGGATYAETLGAQGGVVTINHNGKPFTFNLDCSREAVVCPSEVWPSEVGFRQDNPKFPHRVWLQIPTQSCATTLVEPDPSSCGPNTSNPECAPVCDGEVVTSYKEAFGTIDNAGDSFTVALGVGLASNGVNCLLLGGSYAEGDLQTTGGADEDSWEAVATEGDVVTIYSGGCLWAGDPNMDGELEALAIGASVRFATGFSAKKQ
jgi:hypothetical protein